MRAEFFQWHDNFINARNISSTASSSDTSSLRPDVWSRTQPWVMPFLLETHLIAAAKGQARGKVKESDGFLLQRGNRNMIKPQNENINITSVSLFDVIKGNAYASL